MGGHCVVHAAAAVPGAFGRLVLFDPVIMDPAVYAQPSRWGVDRAEDHPVARRRNEFPSWEAMRDQLVTRGSYGLWDPAVLEDYCRYGLIGDAEAGHLQLACPPLVEASVYFNNRSSDLHERFHEIQQPVLVVRAPPRQAEDDTLDFAKSPTWPALAEQFENGRDLLLEELTHFIPMQAPALTARLIEQPDWRPAGA
jgi:pimeloyl-ACP methyl ester carboxylesterase